jgi:Kef-type K+ transport system membrane component KefB
MIVSLILFFAWISNQLGAPELLGGFAGGVALSRQFFLPFAAMLHDSQEFNHKIHEQMKPIVHLFTPIFFVTIGLSLNLREIDWHSPFIWTLSAGLLAVGIVTKLAAGFALFKESLYSRTLIGTAMVPRGEVGLIFGEVGLDTGVFNNEVYAGIIIVIAATTLIPPFAMRWLCGKQIESPSK